MGWLVFVMANRTVDFFYDRYIEKLKQKARDEANKAISKSYKELFVEVEKDVKEIFHSVIKNFYEDYTPQFYERNESLYDLLQTDRTDNSLQIWFDPTKMTTFRGDSSDGAGYSGEDGLYDQVFRKGWHGGAGSISKEKEEMWGAHPHPGTPYWRTPEPHYTYWGRPAKVSEKSPLDDMRERIFDYSNTVELTKWNDILQKNLNKIRIV